jgi:hypothetical protein
MRVVLSLLLVLTPSALLGQGTCDLNSDGVVDILDVMAEINQVIGVAPCSNGDLNLDGSCNIADAQIIVNAIATGVCSAAGAAPALSGGTVSGSVRPFQLSGSITCSGTTTGPGMIQSFWDGSEVNLAFVPDGLVDVSFPPATMVVSAPCLQISLAEIFFSLPENITSLNSVFDFRSPVDGPPDTKVVIIE